MINIELNNGVKMPILGLGIYKITDKKELYNAVKWALDFGYRKFDTAQFYDNEKELGEAIKNSAIKREEVFITTKIWNSNQGYKLAIESFEESLKKLNMNYVDLLLIHWPGQKKERYLDTWRALEDIYKNKKVRAIGLSNFEIKHLNDILENCKVLPAVNQVERHPNLNVNELIDFCKSHNIVVEAWSPLGRGKFIQNEILKDIAKKYNKTAAQIILRWDIENKVAVIPKSIRKEKIEENINIFDFKLEAEDIKKIDSMNNNERTGFNPLEFDF